MSGQQCRISYHVSHEQFSPRELLELVRHAEAAGFDAAFSSDHINPWAPVQGHSGFIWTWLGAALQGTERLAFTGITVPGGWRYHPVVIAHAIATLAEMFPGRLPWIALGSGEALNECVVGKPWPSKEERNALLEESVQIIRRLFAGETVTHSGRISVRDAKIWSRPALAPRIFGAALTETTADWMGAWADGLVTTAATLQGLAGIGRAFSRRGAGKPMHAKIDLSWAPTDAQALNQAYEQWRFNAIRNAARDELRTPDQFVEAARSVTHEQVKDAVLISSDLSRHVSWLQERAALGFESLDLHNVGRNQREFIDAFGRHVLPALRA